MPHKQEYPPLLEAGFHVKTLAELRALCVDPFKDRGSTTREEIMAGLEILVKRLISCGVVGEIWVDGSFVTDKIEPEDVDILLMVKGEFFDKANQEQLEAMKWVQANLKASHRCDSHLWVSYDPSHPDYGVGKWWEWYWGKLFGFYRDDGPNSYEMKGMALLKVPGCIQ